MAEEADAKVQAHVNWADGFDTNATEEDVEGDANMNESEGDLDLNAAEGGDATNKSSLKVRLYPRLQSQAHQPLNSSSL